MVGGEIAESVVVVAMTETKCGRCRKTVNGWLKKIYINNDMTYDFMHKFMEICLECWVEVEEFLKPKY